MKSSVSFIITLCFQAIIAYKHPRVKAHELQKNSHYFNLLQRKSMCYTYITLYQRRILEFPLHYSVFKSALVATCLKDLVVLMDQPELYPSKTS